MRRQVSRHVLLAKSKRGRATRSRQVSGGAGVVPGSLYQMLSKLPPGRKACVVRKVGGIGDVLMITPALRQLKIDFPKLDLTFAVDMHTTSNNVYYELMKHCPFVGRLVDARFVDHGSYDAVADISAVCYPYEREGLPSINRVDLFARSLGIPRVKDKRSWYEVLPDERLWAARKLSRCPGRHTVVLHTASMEEKRCWPIEKYLDLVRKAEKEQLPVQFIVLDFNGRYSGWSKHPNCSDYSSTTLREMAALIAEADFFIGPDSGPMHLAGAVGTRSLVLFGSIPPKARINYYPSHTPITLAGLSCLGCWYKNCPINIKCMKELPSQRVYSWLAQEIGY